MTVTRFARETNLRRRAQQLSCKLSFIISKKEFCNGREKYSYKHQKIEQHATAYYNIIGPQHKLTYVETNAVSCHL
jgi:hypothetical protein